MDPNTIAALTALIVALTTLITTLVTLAQVVKGRNVSVAQHSELLDTVKSPRPVINRGDQVIVDAPETPAA